MGASCVPWPLPVEAVWPTTGGEATRAGDMSVGAVPKYINGKPALRVTAKNAPVQSSHLPVVISSKFPIVLKCVVS